MTPFLEHGLEEGRSGQDGLGSATSSGVHTTTSYAGRPRPRDGGRRTKVKPGRRPGGRRRADRRRFSSGPSPSRTIRTGRWLPTPAANAAVQVGPEVAITVTVPVETLVPVALKLIVSGFPTGTGLGRLETIAVVLGA